jgi:hypothetical protein
MNSATTQIRIRNKEGVVLTKNGTYLTHIEMDNIGQSDFSRSYLDLQMTFAKVDGSLVKGEKVFMGDIDTQHYYDGQCIIRNARLTCEQFGILEENIKINVYHQTMRRFQQNYQEKQGNEVYGNKYVVPDEITGVAHILVPLSSFLGCGEQIYDHQRLGNSTIRLELEFQQDLFYLATAETGGYFSVPCEDIVNGPGAQPLDITSLETTDKWNSLEQVLQMFSTGNVYEVSYYDENDDPQDTTGTLESISYDPTTKVATFTFEETLFTIPAGSTFDGIDIIDTNGKQLVSQSGTQGTDVPTIGVANATADEFYVGAKYTLGYYVEDVSATAINTWYLTSGILKSVETNGTGVDLTFTDPIIVYPTYTTAGSVNISGWIRIEAFDPLTWSVQQIDLVLHKLLQPMKLGKMVYDTYSLEQTNQPATSSYRKQFYTEPNAYKFAYMTPTSTLLSEINNAESFRISLNNIDLTNRDIPLNQLTNGSLYNDRLVMNVDNLKNVQLDLLPDRQTILYIDRCPIGQQNMVEFKIDGDQMAGVVGCLFKTLTREV